MGSLPGKFVRRDVWDIKSFRLEEKVERLESEVIRMRSQIEGYHKSKSARPSTTTSNNEKYSTCEPHSVELIKRRGSVVIFTEALLKAELQRLRGENNVLSKQLDGIKEESYNRYQARMSHIEKDDQN